MQHSDQGPGKVQQWLLFLAVAEQSRLQPVSLFLSVPPLCQSLYSPFSLVHISFLGLLVKVQVDFTAKEAHPGSTVQLRLQAAPGSLCAVQAVDENMFLVRPESELTSQMVSVCETRRKAGVMDELGEVGRGCGRGSQRLLDGEDFAWRRKCGLPGRWPGTDIYSKGRYSAASGSICSLPNSCLTVIFPRSMVCSLLPTDMDTLPK